MKIFARIILFSLIGFSCACSVATLNPEAQHVEIASEPLSLNRCKYLGEVTGSEGHWYTYLFLANRTMVQAAVDDLRNRAAAIGADTVFIRENTDFVTSVTLLGLAYRCRGNK